MRHAATIAVLFLIAAAGCSSDKLKPYDAAVRESAPPPTSPRECARDELLVCKTRGPERVCGCVNRRAARSLLPPDRQTHY